MIGWLGAVWGFSGVVLFLGYAIFRLAPRALESFELELSWYHWAFLSIFAVFMLFAEGYRGFQKKFSPRTAARVNYLKENPVWWHVLIAPVFCMGFIHATRKTRITSICLSLGIVLLVVLVRFIPMPWRGLVDFGVVLGLSYGIASFAWFSAKALFGSGHDASPEVP